jgi:hypothetical protein
MRPANRSANSPANQSSIAGEKIWSPIGADWGKIESFLKITSFAKTNVIKRNTRLDDAYRRGEPT